MVLTVLTVINKIFQLGERRGKKSLFFYFFYFKFQSMTPTLDVYYLSLDRETSISFLF